MRILGDPGSGKTTTLCEIACVLSKCQNVVVVNTTNEIGGYGDVPHSSIGMARRMIVPSLDCQHAVMLECVQNHNPHTILVDEIGWSNEVAVAAKIKKDGVQIVASARGDRRGIVNTQGLSGLVGGVPLLGKEMASQQRVELPTFDLIIEVQRGARLNGRSSPTLPRLSILS